jgi:hypothetical protein
MPKSVEKSSRKRERSFALPNNAKSRKLKMYLSLLLQKNRAKQVPIRIRENPNGFKRVLPSEQILKNPKGFH